MHELVDTGSERLSGFSLRARNAFFRGTNHQSNLSFGRVSFEGLKEFRELAAAKLFVDLGDFAGETSLTIAEDCGCVGDGLGYTMGGLVEDQRAVFNAETFQSALAFAAAGRKEAEKEKFVIGKSGSRKSGEERRGARDRNDWDAMANGESDETMAGVGHERHASIAHQGDIGALFHGEDQFGRARKFVVLVIADERFVNVEVIQKLKRVAGVFAGDLVDFLENAKGAKRDVFEVADRSGDEVQPAGRGWLGRKGIGVRIHGAKSESNMPGRVVEGACYNGVLKAA